MFRHLPGKTTGRAPFTCLPLVLAALFGAAESSPVRAGQLEQKLREAAPQVLDHMMKKGCGRLGVLKGRVFLDGRVSDGIGPINRAFADRLERALIYGGDPVTHAKITLLANATAVAAGLPGASHLNKEGVAKLFQGQYTPYWPRVNNKVPADGFVFGSILADVKLTKLNVKLCGLGNDGKPPSKILEFDVDVDVEVMLLLGRGFSLKGPFAKGRLTKGDNDQEKEKQKGDEARDYLETRKKEDPASPSTEDQLATLEVYYVDKADVREARGKPHEFDLSRLRHDPPHIIRRPNQEVPEPQEGQCLYLVVRRADPTFKGKLGVVITVNGKSLFNEQTGSPKLCVKWILSENKASEVLTGYFYNTGPKPVWRELEIKSAKESEELAAMNYDEKFGQISMHVFVEGENKKPNAGDQLRRVTERKLAAPAKDPNVQEPSWEDLQKKGQAADLLMGVAGPGQQFNRPVEKVEFKDPQLITSCTVTYYKAKKKP